MQDKLTRPIKLKNVKGVCYKHKTKYITGGSTGSTGLPSRRITESMRTKNEKKLLVINNIVQFSLVQTQLLVVPGGGG